MTSLVQEVLDPIKIKKKILQILTVSAEFCTCDLALQQHTEGRGFQYVEEETC